MLTAVSLPQLSVAYQVRLRLVFVELHEVLTLLTACYCLHLAYLCLAGQGTQKQSPRMCMALGLPAARHCCCMGSLCVGQA